MSDGLGCGSRLWRHARRYRQPWVTRERQLEYIHAEHLRGKPRDLILCEIEFAEIDKLDDLWWNRTQSICTCVETDLVSAAVESTHPPNKCIQRRLTERKHSQTVKGEKFQW